MTYCVGMRRKKNINTVTNDKADRRKCGADFVTSNNKTSHFELKRHLKYTRVMNHFTVIKHK